MPSFGLPSARAEASRQNGAKSRGPKTPEGKARSAQNALKHGLRAEKFVVLGDEDLAAFDALEAALMAELAPQGALQAVLARRIVAATWRLERAERMEAELFARNIWGTTSFGLALIRDCNGARAFDTLLRYRGGTLAELWRALRTLKALQAEARACDAPARVVVAEPRLPDAPHAAPIKPENRGNSGGSCQPVDRADPGDAGRSLPGRRSGRCRSRVAPRHARDRSTPRPAAGLPNPRRRPSRMAARIVPAR
jgi:hypothetical protein